MKNVLHHDCGCFSEGTRGAGLALNRMSSRNPTSPAPFVSTDKLLEDIKSCMKHNVLVRAGFNWMVGVLKKIIAEATGTKMESKMPPLIEFFGPEVLKVLIKYQAIGLMEMCFYQRHQHFSLQTI